MVSRLVVPASASTLDGRALSSRRHRPWAVHPFAGTRPNDQDLGLAVHTEEARECTAQLKLRLGLRGPKRCVCDAELTCSPYAAQARLLHHFSAHARSALVYRASPCCHRHPYGTWRVRGTVRSSFSCARACREVSRQSGPPAPRRYEQPALLVAKGRSPLRLWRTRTAPWTGFVRLETYGHAFLLYLKAHYLDSRINTDSKVYSDSGIPYVTLRL
jgi:hypothetical protein